MAGTYSHTFIAEKLRTRLELFFPGANYSAAALEEGLESGDLFIKPEQILPFLRTVFLDEKILEVELDGLTRIYFSRLYDDPPPPVEREVDGEIVLVDPDYQPGDYLQNFSHLISLPLEPGIGNVSIRHSKRIVLRFFMTNYAVELGCSYQDLTTVDDIPVLRLSYPIVGRIIRGAREFRAKVPHDYDLEIVVAGKGKQADIETRLVNISVHGCSFSITKAQQQLLKVDEIRDIEFIYAGSSVLHIDSNVRHVSKIRGKNGTEYVCGVLFDLVTRTAASKIEEIVAAVQRAHLKELAELSENSGWDLVT